MEQTDFDLAVDFDVDALFPFLSNTDTGFFNFDSFVDDVFSIPNSTSQSEMTIPRFTELNGDEQFETINTDDNEATPGPAPAIVAQVESGKKTRTRRKTTAIVKGCNMYGRAGKRRCIQCRKWRQKCVYETLDDPCKLCRERGFQCGREEKVLGPKTHIKLSDEDIDVSNRQLVFAIPRHSPSILADELTPAEIHCFSTLTLRPHSHSTSGILFHSSASLARHYSLMGAVVLWPVFPLSSKVFRYAALALSSSMKPSLTDNPNGDAPAYLTKFYRYMREAIDASSILEVFVASYAMVMESWYLGKHLQTVITHFKGMSAAYSLLSDGVSATATSSYSASYCNALMLSSSVMVFEAYFLRPPFESTEFKQCQELDECVRTLRDAPAIGRNSPVRLSYLDRYLRFYLDYYLLLKRHQASSMETSDVRLRILAILSDIFRLIPFVSEVREVINAALDPSLPWPWHGNSLIMDNVLDKILTNDEFGISEAATAAMIYGGAILIAEAVGGSISPLQSPPEFNTSPGLFMCRLCALVSSFDAQFDAVLPRLYLLPRIFWAGVGLTDGVDCAASAWVCDMLDNHAFWTNNRWLYPQDQWCLNSLRQSLSRGNTEGRQPGVPLLECKGVDILECNRIAERAACHRDRHFGRCFAE